MDEKRPLTGNIQPEGPPDLATYERAGGYAALRRVLRRMTPEEVTAEVKAANLRGRGGAGFPAGLKWASMPGLDDPRRPRYFIVNADEMEPGAFKDRYLMEGDPHQLIEGLIIAAYAVQADQGVIFIRAEYPEAARGLRRAIEEAHAAGYLGRRVAGSGWGFDIRVHVSAGRYLSGESSALLDAMEGGRAVPRPTPPRSPDVGVWGLPTMVNNVETICCVPHIVERGADWFLGVSRAPEGKHGVDGGTKLYGASGPVARAGIWELPIGTPAREILEEHAGGMRKGSTLRGFQPGGASTGFLAADALDVPMDFDSVQGAGSRLGTGTLILLDDHTCPVGYVHNLERFFARESCGWCTPCREGLPWTERLLADLETGRGTPAHIEQLQWHTHFLGMGFTFCAHAPGAMMPLESAMALFREDFDRHLDFGHCPFANEPAEEG